MVAWYLVAALLAAVVGASVCQSVSRPFRDPGEVSVAEVARAIRELRELMQEAGRSQEEINRTLHDLRCRYLPDTTEGCDDATRNQDEQRQGQGTW